MMQTNLENRRDYGLDLLRCLSMLFVVVSHVLGHGGLGAAYAPGSVGGWLVSLVGIAAYPAVDSFVLLSGYLLCNLRFKLSRIVRTWTTAFFWAVLIQSVFFLINPETISPGRVLYTFLPILKTQYWFLNAYVAMMLASPALNRLLRDMPRWQLQGLLLAALAVCSVAPMFAFGDDVFGIRNGYSFTWFLVLYLWGGYIRLYSPVSGLEKKRGYLAGWLLLNGFHLLWTKLTEALIPGLGVSGLFMKYSSLPVFGAALCLLQFFRGLQIPGGSCRARLLERLSPLAFGVYLIHDHPLVRETLILDRFAGAAKLPGWQAALWATGAACGIYAVCICLEWLRTLLFRVLRVNRVSDSLCRKLTDKFERLLKGDLWTSIL